MRQLVGWDRVSRLIARTVHFASAGLALGAARGLALGMAGACLAQTIPEEPAAPPEIATPTIPIEVRLAAPPPEPPPDEEDPPGSSEVRVSEYMTVDIIAQNDHVTNILQKLAVQAWRNIIPAQDVDRRVSATMYGVPFLDALDALLRPNGLGYMERGEFIFVYPADVLAELLKDEKETVTRIILLDYIRSEDALRFAEPLLSDDGSVTATRDLEIESTSAGTGGAGQSLGAQASDIYSPDIDEYALSSAVIVTDYPEIVAEIEMLLAELDTRPAQVLIEATVLQTSLDESNAFGVDFALLNGVNFTSFFNFASGGLPLGLRDVLDDDGNRTGPPLSGDEGFLIGSPGNTALGPASVRGGYITDDVGVFIRALDQVTDVTLLSNPKVLALNRQRAKVLVGTKVSYLETTIVENRVLENTEFIDTGISLDMRPFILSDGRIRIELAPKVSAVEFREVDGPSGGKRQLPDERVQTVNTNILLPEGYTAVIGGLFREDTTQTRTQVPLLGDLPFIGAAFRGYDDTTSEVEVIFLIKATVLHDDVLIEQGRRAEEYEDHIRVGSRMGLLPFSRKRQSASLSMSAERLARDGQPFWALWNLRRSLELNPHQPAAIHLLEQLVTDPVSWPSRSVFERIINAELDVDVEPAPAPEG